MLTGIGMLIFGSNIFLSLLGLLIRNSLGAISFFWGLNVILRSCKFDDL